jgi:glyoxylase-like metal-dependent hydrolase (beta-lactamase superfamily II)
LEKGKGYLKPIAEVTDKPVTHVIYSHDHTDTIGAAYLFPKSAVYIGAKEDRGLRKILSPKQRFF